MSGLIITPDLIIGKYFIRYERLNSLLNYAYSGMEVNRVNIFIDLYSIYHTVFSRSDRTNITNYVSFTSQIINLCAHYRTYFRSLGIYTKIFLISSYNVPVDSIALVPEYNRIMRDKLKNKTVMEMVDLNTGLLEIICPYLPDIHFLKTEFESSVLISSIIEKEMYSENSKVPIQSIILSSDFYPVQLTALLPNVSYLYPIKSYPNDNSMIIPPNTSSDAFQAFWSVILRKSSNSSSFNRVGSIAPSNYMLLAALNKFPDRCISLIYNVSTSCKLISQILGFDSIKLTPQSLFDLLPIESFNGVDLNLITNRYKVLDVQYQNILYSNSVESKTIHYENLEDNNAINLINDKYFRDNPIDIFRL